MSDLVVVVLMVEDFVLVAYALSLELLEPAFGDAFRNSVDHPFRETAHDIKTIDEEEFSDFLA